VPNVTIHFFQYRTARGSIVEEASVIVDTALAVLPQQPEVGPRTHAEGVS
jgi:hypothetical protein